MTVNPKIKCNFLKCNRNFGSKLCHGWMISVVVHDVKSLVISLVMRELLEPNKFCGILILGMRFKFKQVKACFIFFYVQVVIFFYQFS